LDRVWERHAEENSSSRTPEIKRTFKGRGGNGSRSDGGMEGGGGCGKLEGEFEENLWVKNKPAASGKRGEEWEVRDISGGGKERLQNRN